MVTLNTEAAPVAPSRGADERGFGVVEIIVSMFLLLVIAAAFLPLLIQAMRITQLNTTVASATQIVNEQLNTARTDVMSCATLNAFAAETLNATIDPRGVTLTPHRSLVTGCPTGAAVYPATAKIKVWVTDDAGDVLSETVALVLLKTA